MSVLRRKRITTPSTNPPPGYMDQFINLAGQPSLLDENGIVHLETIGHVETGIALNTDFSGSPKKCTVSFVVPFLDTNYVVFIQGQDLRSWSYESKTTNGFTINTNAATALTGEVSWTARLPGSSG